MAPNGCVPTWLCAGARPEVSRVQVGLSPKASKKILELAREQQLDEASDDDDGSVDLEYVHARPTPRELLADGVGSPRLVARQQANGDAMSSDEGEDAGEEFEGFGSDAGDDVYEELVRNSSSLSDIRELSIVTGHRQRRSGDPRLALGWRLSELGRPDHGQAR